MITVTISSAELKKADACSGGRALFDQIRDLANAQRAAEGKLPRRGLTVRWSRVHALWLAWAYPSFASWLIEYGFVPQVACARANLESANLRSANLRSANLYGANLESANLRSANLRSANLYGANLYGANLESALWAANREAPEGWESHTESCKCCARLRRRSS